MFGKSTQPRQNNPSFDSEYVMKSNVSDKVGIYFLSSLTTEIPFAPVIDGELFNDFPSKVLANDLSDELAFFKSLDMIIGNCNMEGSLYLGMTPQE